MKIRTKIKILAPADRAWEVIAGEFGDAAKWASTLESSSSKEKLGIGATRTCQTKGVGPFPSATIKEKLVDYDPKQLTFTYVVQSGLPSIFKSAQNSWSIEPINETSCFIHSNVFMEVSLWLRPLSWIFPLLLKRDLKNTFEELSYYIEQGKPHPRKTNSKSKLAKV